MSVYEQIKQLLQDIVAPELKAIHTEIKHLNDKIESVKTEILIEIKRLDEKTDRLDEKIDEKIDRLDEKIDERTDRLDEKIDRVDEKIDTAMQIRERLAAVEAKLAAMRQ